MSATTCPNPDCGADLKETAKPHCQEQRAGLCHWVTCTKCHTRLDKHGKWFTPPPAQTA